MNPENVLPDYPRPQLVRGQWANLNGEWEFEAAKEDDAVPTGRTLGEKNPRAFCSRIGIVRD